MTKTCTVCEGRGKQTTTVTVHGEKGESSFEMDCLWCKGTGQMTEVQEAEHREFCEMWCECEEPGDPRYYDDGEHPAMHKHHWRCRECEGVTQIG